MAPLSSPALVLRGLLIDPVLVDVKCMCVPALFTTVALNCSQIILLWSLSAVRWFFQMTAPYTEHPYVYVTVLRSQDPSWRCVCVCASCRVLSARVLFVCML